MRRLKIISSVNKWLKCLDTQLKEPTNQNTIKVLKVIQPTNKKPYYKLLWGTSPIISPMFLLSLLNAFPVEIHKLASL